MSANVGANVGANMTANMTANVTANMSANMSANVLHSAAPVRTDSATASQAVATCRSSPIACT